MNTFFHRTSRLGGAIVLIAVAAGLSACSPEPKADSQATTHYDSALIVAGTHANSPAPRLDDQATQIVKDIMHNDGAVGLIRISGQPKVVEDLELREIEGTPAGRDVLVKKNLKQITEALSVPSDADGADGWEAVTMAADELRSKKAKSPIIIFVSSGLSDRGRLDFTVPGMISADPDDVVKYLSQTHGIPDLSSITVLLDGIGYSAAPQDPLDGAQRANVTEIWRTSLDAAGATVLVSPSPQTSPSLDTDAVVKTVDVPRTATPPQCSRDEIIFSDQSEVSFHPESTVFVDHSAATAALRSISTWLLSDPDRKAVVRGTTADDRGDRERLRRLGAQRAEAVVTELTRAGVAPNQLTAVGVGADFPEYVRPDIDEATGLLLPGPASLNRSVRIALDDPC